MPTDAERTTAMLFLEFSRKKLLEQYWPRLRACVESLSDDQISPSPSCDHAPPLSRTELTAGIPPSATGRTVRAGPLSNRVRRAA